MSSPLTDLTNRLQQKCQRPLSKGPSAIPVPMKLATVLEKLTVTQAQQAEALRPLHSAPRGRNFLSPSRKNFAWPRNAPARRDGLRMDSSDQQARQRELRTPRSKTARPANLGTEDAVTRAVGSQKCTWGVRSRSADNLALSPREEADASAQFVRANWKRTTAPARTPRGKPGSQSACGSPVAPGLVPRMNIGQPRRKRWQDEDAISVVSAPSRCGPNREYAMSPRPRSPMTSGFMDIGAPRSRSVPRGALSNKGSKEELSTLSVPSCMGTGDPVPRTPRRRQGAMIGKPLRTARGGATTMSKSATTSCLVGGSASAATTPRTTTFVSSGPMRSNRAMISGDAEKRRQANRQQAAANRSAAAKSRAAGIGQPRVIPVTGRLTAENLAALEKEKGAAMTPEEKIHNRAPSI